MEPTDDPTSVTDVCRIASGIQLLRDLGAPHVLKTCESFEGSVYNYLEQCPKILKHSDIPRPCLWRDSHWWWQIVSSPSEFDLVRGVFSDGNYGKCNLIEQIIM